MPYRLALDAPRRLALMAFTGDVGGDEIVRASAELVRTAGDGPLDVVCDLSEVASLDLAPGDLEAILSVKLEGPPADADPRRDVVIARRELDRLLARFYALLGRRRGLDVRICRTREEARQWLDVEALPDVPVAS
jgi:hypothetical protein